MTSHSSRIRHSSIISRIPFFYGWVILAASALVVFISSPGQTFLISVFIDPIISELGWSRTLISSLYTAGSLTAGVAVIFVGRLLDRYGARIILLAVGILFGLAALWMSAVDHPVKLYFGFAALRTLGQGSLGLITSTLIALWFVRLRGRAMAIGGIGGAIGMATFPIMAHALIFHTSWRNAWVVLALAIWVVLVPIVLLVRRSPESAGLLPDGKPAQQPKEQAVGARVSTAQEVDFSLSEALRTRAFWLLLFATSSLPLIGTGLSFHQISFLASKGIQTGAATAVFSVIGPSQVLGTFIAGFMADRFPNRYLLVVGQVLLGMAMLWTFLITSSWQAFTYGAILGLSMGFIMNVAAVIWPNYYGRLHLGSIRGVSMASTVVFAALGPLPFGLVYDITGDYSLAILVLLALPVLCAVASLLAHPPKKRRSEGISFGQTSS
ncbi:L-lactate transporter [subsurface metagenome]